MTVTCTYTGPFRRVTLALPGRRIRAARGGTVEFTDAEFSLLDPTQWVADPIRSLGGGWYETPDGHRHRGRLAAETHQHTSTKEA